ncbi:MAG: bifunctional glutamate N-acetyltransferase/amino-acid acetyltransferase ArgJ [Deinococcota bacterium]|nr:bifunctional glutamate N-acetyltransferase/amino-acid acetyltransferase ArgJ [Deinococcota bacterium]
MKLPRGFQAAGVAAGIKLSGAPDLALIYAPMPLAWALTTTRNLVRAPFIDRNRERFASGQPVRAVAVNAGNANCATGEQGALDNEAFAAEAARAVGVERVHEVLTASTGVIGQPLPMERIRAALPRLAQNLGEEADAAATAIMTTDTRPKLAAVTLAGGARVVGIAKGSGMIHPDMATMLAFVMTDAAIPQAELRSLWPGVVSESFNQVTVDGDTSPNDMAALLCSAQVDADQSDFVSALRQVCGDLARDIARDGEGATKLITVVVTGARNADEAKLAARAIARSPLAKAAAYGNDPNWGRILVALGYSGAGFEPARVSIALQGSLVYSGAPRPFDAGALSRRMNSPDLLIEVDLAAGGARGSAWGCDLTADYVKINADYHT